MQGPSRGVIKVGGSLYDWPEFPGRLRAFLPKWTHDKILLVPGGGEAADVVRAWDRLHALGEEAAHRLALRSLSFNAHFLATLLPGVPVVASWSSEPLAILDGFAFAQADEGNEDHLPHCWEASSDALAARAAQVYQANQLILLKSVDVDPALSWEEAAQQGYVDPCFPGVVAACQFPLEVRIINLRSWTSGH